MPGAAGHYLPEFYLKGFTERKGLLWVHEKHCAPRSSSPKHEANQQDFYAITSQALEPDALEQMYAKTESVVARPISKSRNALFTMTDDEAGNIRAFVALAFTRVPHYIDFVRKSQVAIAKKIFARKAADEAGFRAMAEEVRDRTGLTIDIEKARQMFLHKDYGLLHKSNDLTLSSMLKASQTVMGILVSEFEHDLIYAPERSAFITTDSPVMTLISHPDGTASFGVGFGHRATEVFYPLNKRAAMHLRRDAKRQKIHVSADRVDEINRALMGWGQRFMYASSGERRLGRIFSQRAGSVRFGQTALMHPGVDLTEK